MMKLAPAPVRLLLVVAALAAATLAPAGATHYVGTYHQGDFAIRAYNILPPGQGRHLTTEKFLETSAGLATGPAENTNQLAKYDSLIGAVAGGLDDSEIGSYFKDASFGVSGAVERQYSPRTDVTILRDAAYNVPHIYGATRAGAMFGAGYASGEDRLFMMDALRHVARGRLSEFLGASEANLASDRAQRLVADYTDVELQAMGLRLMELDPVLGLQAYSDVASFVDGVNAYIAEVRSDPTKLPAEYPALQLLPEPWKITDSIALSTLIGGQFSVGGGGQIANDALLDALEDKGYSAPDARKIFDDLRFANDPEAPVTTTTAFPFNASLGTPNPASVARPDDPQSVLLSMNLAARPSAIDGPFGKIRLFSEDAGASNALLVSGAATDSGRPYAVFGPQVGYYSPEILMEIDIHGPGVHARGAAFPGISIYALLGRGADYGWSATTAVGDHIDIRAVKLCDPAGGQATLKSTGYLRDNVCHPMYRRTDTWVAKPSAGGQPGVTTGSPPNVQPAAGDEVLVSMTTERVKLGDPGAPFGGLEGVSIGPDWAIVVTRSTVGGDPVAFVRQRSSYGIEVDATLTFALIHNPDNISSVTDLQHAFCDHFSFSFNWFLIDGNDIGFCTTGRYPTMAPGVDPDLPFWGDSQWDWNGFLSYSQHPQALDPTTIINWNNKQAPDFRASDNWFSYGPVGRVQLLQDGVQGFISGGDNKVSLSELVSAMETAATRDVRGVYTLPAMLQLMGSPTDPKEANAVSMLSAWVAGGAHRRDLDNDARYDDRPAVALMDALWTPAIAAVFGPALGDALAKVPISHNLPGPGGSAFLSGWQGHIQKDLRSVLGDSVSQPFSRMYCGAGVETACRTALLTALDGAIAALEAKYGTNSANWGLSTSATGQVQDDSYVRDQINYSAVGLVDQANMDWQNRPTFQQVLEFGTP
jgi:acyl-homoserine lactone acylase PvdQ